MLHQKLTSISANVAQMLFYFNDNIFRMDCPNPIMLNSKSKDNHMGSAASFYFELDLNLLNESKDTAVGKLFKWTFEVGRIIWSLGIFPSGINNEHRGYTSIFLYKQLVGKHEFKWDETIRVYFSFDYDSDRVFDYNFRYGEACGLTRWGENKGSNKSGRFVMMYSFNEFCQPLSYNLDTICIDDTKPRDTDVLFKKPYDIEMEGEGSTYYFISEFLSARSTILPTLLKESSKNREIQTINLPDVRCGLMESIISYLMKGRIRLNVESIEKVCKVATCLDIMDLKLACEYFLLFSHLIKNDFLKVLAIAYNYDLKMIKSECLTYILTNLNSIFVLPDWETVRLNNPTVLLDITKHLALTRIFTRKPDYVFRRYDGFDCPSSRILGCSKTVINAYDISNEGLSGVIVKLKFDIPVEKINDTNIYSFQAEETKWSLCIFTDIKSKDYLSICLCNRSTGKVSVDFMLDWDRGNTYFHEFSGEGKWGCPEWKLIDDLNGGPLTVNFVMRQKKQLLKTVEKGGKTNSVYRFIQTSDEISNVNFTSPQDILLVGDGWEYNAHREILSAQSPVFAAMFSHDMKENNEKTIRIADVSSVAMKAILSFIYNGRIEISDEKVLDICAAADKYLLGLIKLACEHVLCDMTVETVSDRYICAKMYNLAILKSTCVRFITKNLNAVVQTEGWLHLTNQTTLAEKLLATLNKQFQPVTAQQFK